MILLNQLLSVFWVLFMLYWLISAMQSKKTLKNSLWRKGITVRILMLIAIILLFKNSTFQQLAASYTNAPHELLGIIGIILCVLGLGFAVWARIHLGRNWGMPMSLKENAELITTGPYKFVRHPIYTGVLLAVLGSSLVGGLWWLILFVFFSIYFAIYATREEEKIMMKEFAVR